MAGNGDIKDHQATFDFFMSLLKVSTVITIVVAAFVIWLIAA
ncbi:MULTISPECIES: aa3-type cytochrome c oxidase subunit IV [unclassified Sphingomonas]|jgi:hypothetical protein|nr:MULTISPECIES: aa3-type cytochrome c oxidase subunit IV [unclassified Sphingomonas]MCH4894489.1 aa3-type cytochrome c oxidase subunit IV [Sphingomonas sp. SFZ2018-12]